MLPEKVSRLIFFFAFILSASAFPPEDLSSYQNHYICDAAVRLVRPRSHSDVEEAVKRHDNVKAMGVGHSYNDFFCARAPGDTPEEDDTSAGIVMTTIRPMLIDVNEPEMSVWVSGGVQIWELVEYLANYNTESSPWGYTLGATPWFVNQTIAGAIATNTHGSSLTHGSMSNQAIGFRVVLANGTTTEISQESHPLYFKALQVNVGRLGVVTDVKLRIIKETVITRTLYTEVPGEIVLPKIRRAQEMYKKTGMLPKWLDDTVILLDPLNFTSLVWTFRDEGEVDFTDLRPFRDSDSYFIDNETEEFLESYLMDRVNAPMNLSRTENGIDIAAGVSWEEPVPFPPIERFVDAANTPAIMDDDFETFTTYVGNATRDRHQASWNLPQPFSEIIETLLVDDYEVSVPVDKMADCLEGAIAILESQAPDIGHRGRIFLRFLGKETGLLAPSNDKPRLFMANQDFVYYNQGSESNIPLKRFIGYLVSSPLCAPARLHWGHAGWPEAGCWNGAEHYPETWCDFGCAVKDLDPYGKFAGNMPGIWNWEGADLDKCCTADGYDRSLYGCDCAVARQRHPDECPEAPFYSER